MNDPTPHCFPCETTEMIRTPLSTAEISYYKCPHCGHIVVIFGKKLQEHIAKLAGRS